ncbi:MAG TPA: glycerol-3-phosphate 1-O-acyltransferase PlsY [Kofleriaceae bacterium]|nr:glycerol-3-phosphate 1-O-acyltransferase PlsY [Kofleriaceae bacterium]
MNLLVLVAGFFAGAIPFGVIVAKRRGVDIRKQGSGNIGATNVTRVMGLSAGLLVLVLDALKGAAAVMLATRYSGMDPIIAMAGFAAILGHCFSPFLNGKGGKGVATALGVFAVVAPALVFVAVGVFLVVAGRWRIPALGSLAGVTSAAVYSLATRQPMDVTLLVLATLVLLVYTHRGNLQRLITSAR